MRSGQASFLFPRLSAEASSGENGHHMQHIFAPDPFPESREKEVC